MKPHAVARRYARALADIAGRHDPKNLEHVGVEVSNLATIVERDPQIARFFDDPSIRPQDKEAAAETIVRRLTLGDLTQRFLAVLIENRRLAELPSMAAALREIVDERMGVVPAETTTAVPLSSEETRDLRKALEKMTGRTVRLTLTVDSKVLGGVRTRVGSRVYDGTLKRQLASLRRQLGEAR